MSPFRLFAFSALLTFILSIGVLYIHGEDKVFGQYPVIDGIRCDSGEHFEFHYHAHLSVFVDGFSYLVPEGIGIKRPDCIYWLHTHDTCGESFI